MANKQLYDQDLYAWALENAELMRQGRFDEVDVQHIVEELEALGASEKRELSSRIEVLLMHLLKWEYQPSHQGRSWRLTIGNQRLDIERLLDDNPSLKSKLSEVLDKSYLRAAKKAHLETDLPISVFPKKCPYTLEQVLDDEFWPKPH